jgi:D-alanine--D-alanine ligase
MAVQDLSQKLHIGVLRGGPSSKYDDSLQTGNLVINSLADTHRPIDIFISSDGQWHMNGIEKNPENILRNVDVVFNALHGAYGEDGGVQEILNRYGSRYTGSDRYESAIAMNRWFAKEKAKSLGIKTPVAMLVRQNDNLSEKAKEIWGSIQNPLVVKPARGGYSLAYHKIDSFHDLLGALEEVLATHDSAVVEEYLVGTRASSGTINGFRGKDFYTLTPVELNSDNHASFPTRFTDEQKEEIQKISKLIHKGLGLKHYSVSDLIVTPRRGVYFLEISTHPVMTEKSPIIKSLEAVGVSIKELIHHLVNAALNRN